MLKEKVGHGATDHDTVAWTAELLQHSIPQQGRGLHELLLNSPNALWLFFHY